MRKQSKKSINLANISQNAKPQAGDVLISSFLPSTGGQSPEQSLFSLTVRQRGQDSLKQAILTTKAMKSKSKKLFQHGVKNWLLLRWCWHLRSPQEGLKEGDPDGPAADWGRHA